VFLYGGANRKKFNQEFFGPELFDRHPYKLGVLKFSHLLNENNQFLGYNAFLQKFNLNIPEEKFNIIIRFATDVREERENLQVGKKGVDILTFCNRFKKGSKPFRRKFSRISLRKRFRETSTPTQKTHKQ
jgi:hypothetical protein